MWKDIYPQDRVITKRGRHKGTVTHVWRNGIGGKVCNVKFDDQGLIPPEMDYPEHELELLDTGWDDDYYYGGSRKKSYGPIEEYCPECGTKWTVTKFNKIVWKDCKICKKTYEQITKGRS